MFCQSHLRSEILGRKRSYAAYYRSVRPGLVNAQKQAVKEWCEERGITLTAEYKNEEVDDMLRAAEAGEFNVLILHSLPAIFRNTFGMISFMLNLHDCGVTLMTATGKQLKGLDSLLSEFNRVRTSERQLISGRTQAAVARAKAAGKRLGRKPGNYAAKYRQVKKMRREGKTYVDIANAVQLSVSHVYYHLNPDKKKA